MIKLQLFAYLYGVKIRLLLFCALVYSAKLVHGQSFFEKPDTLNKKRVIGITTGGAIAWGGTISALGFVWYDDFEKAPFHFFDDSREWNQMDKFGHLYISHHTASFISSAYQWAGVSKKNAAIIGSAYSFGYMTTFELLDAYNAKWGFSWSDIGFNALGVGTFFVQDYFLDQRYVHFKFSSHQSGLAQYRPNVLGSDYPSRLLKDYNGQTYWASFNPFEWFTTEPLVPKWLNFSVGYSTNNQLYGDGSVAVLVNDDGSTTTFSPYRQLFFSLDVNWQAIETDSKFLRLVFKGLNKVKLPFPAVEISQGGIQFLPFYF